MPRPRGGVGQKTAADDLEIIRKMAEGTVTRRSQACSTASAVGPARASDGISTAWRVCEAKRISGLEDWGDEASRGGLRALKIFENDKIIEAGCMAHSRRKFFDALQKASEHAQPALQAMRALYAVERECKKDSLSDEARLARRQQESAPTFNALRDWLAELRSHVLPKSPIGRAVGYFDRHSDALGRFLEDGRIEIDNNRCERAMRQVATRSNIHRLHGILGIPPQGQARAA